MVRTLVAALSVVLVPMMTLAQERLVEPAPAPFSIEGALRGGVQWIVDPPHARHDVFGSGAFDIMVTVRPMPAVTLFIDLEAFGGPGPDVALGTLSRLNAEAERLEGRDARVFLREGWLSLQRCGERLLRDDREPRMDLLGPESGHRRTQPRRPRAGPEGSHPVLALSGGHW